MFKTNQHLDAKVVSIGLEAKAHTGSHYKAFCISGLSKGKNANIASNVNISFKSFFIKLFP